MEVWGGNYTTEESVRLPGLTGHVIAQPSRGRLRGDIFLLSVCSVAVMAKVLILDTFNRGPEMGLLSQEMRRLLATYGSEYDNSRLIGSFLRGLSRLEGLTEQISLTAATFDTRTRELIYAYRDEPDILISSADHSHWSRPGTGSGSDRKIPLGCLHNSDYIQSATRLLPKDRVVLYTSGLLSLFDSEDPAGRLDKFRDRLNEIDQDNPESIARSLTASLEDSGAGGTSERPDLLLLVLRALA
jgi:serine phosphatase RsbU (regulator of sigma subunit)